MVSVASNLRSFTDKLGSLVTFATTMSRARPFGGRCTDSAGTRWPSASAWGLEYATGWKPE